MKDCKVAITAEPSYESQANHLAKSLSLPLADTRDPGPEFFLQFSKDRLQLQQNGDKAPGPVYVDFVQGKAAHRRNQGEGRKTPLARAAGFKPNYTPQILDGTAGLGQDAFVLATLGCQMLLIEQSPIIHALLEDGLRRAAEHFETRDIVARMTLLQANTADYLQQLAQTDRPEVIYLDPMYPHTGKNALAKKEMQSFQKLLGNDQNGPELLHVARKSALKRIAVKRPMKAVFLGNITPDFQILAPKTRFDVYLPS